MASRPPTFQHIVSPYESIVKGDFDPLHETRAMDIRQIRYFVHAVEGKSLSAAAKRQFVTVQAVSKAISELEHELGIQLLTRGNHGVKPTAVGVAFYERARKTLANFDELDVFTKHFPTSRDNEHMSIALCSPSFANAEGVMASLSKFIGKRLGLDLEIFIAPGRESIEALHAGVIDAACTLGEYASPGTDCVSVGSLPTGVALARTHPLAHNRAITLSEMAPYPVVWSETFDDFNRSIHAMYRERGLASEAVRFPSNATDEQVSAFFSEQNGMAFGAVLPFNQTSGNLLTFLPVDQCDQVRVPLCLISLKSQKTDAYRAFERSAATIFRGGQILGSS